MTRDHSYCRGENWGSLKSLEKILATIIPADEARATLSTLAGTYDLRLADAHMPSDKIANAMQLAGLTADIPMHSLGKKLITNVATALEAIVKQLV